VSVVSGDVTGIVDAVDHRARQGPSTEYRQSVASDSLHGRDQFVVVYAAIIGPVTPAAQRVCPQPRAFEQLGTMRGQPY